MPEIAEVELVRRGLAELAGARLERVELFDPRLPDELDQLEGRRLDCLRRKGKLLGLEFGELVLEIHLRMTGSLQRGRRERARAVLLFEGGRPISFVDPRRFGTLRIAPAERFGGKLGFDLLDEQPPEWPPRQARSRRAIKALLLDQAVVAGIGNYIVDETLWRSEIAPQRPAAELAEPEWEALLGHARAIAREALEAGGMTRRDYKRPDGGSGNMLSRLVCYGRAGQPCVRCGQRLRSGEVGGRGTTWCPGCQK